MSFVELLDALNKRRIDLYVEEGSLRYQAPRGALDDDLIARIREHRAELVAHFTPAAGASRSAPVDAPYPLSPGQQALWFIHQLDQSNLAYNIVYASRLTYDLDIALLQDALRSLHTRHPMLGTRFIVVDGVPYQQEIPDFSPSLPITAASGWSHADVDRFILELADQPFDLEAAPPVRWHLITGAVNGAAPTPILVMVAHHTVIDFRSIEVVLRDLSHLYSAVRDGKPTSLPALPWRYRDHVGSTSGWLQSAAGRSAREYWLGALGGELPVLELPTDFVRPQQQRYEGSTLFGNLPPDLTERVRAFARQQLTTPNVVLLSALGILLNRYSGQTEVLVGSPMLGRNRSEVDEVVGYFVNPVVLRLNFEGDPTVQTLLQRLRHNVLEALSHQDYPFPLLVETLQPHRDPSRSPLFQVAFVYERESGAAIETQGLIAELVTGAQRGSAFDITLIALDRGDSIRLSWEYATSLFRPATAERMLAHYLSILRALLDAAEAPVASLSFLDERETRQLRAWNDTDAPFPEHCTLADLFAAQVSRTPDNIAVEHHDRQLSYRELDRLAGGLASELRTLGVGPNDAVGIALPRSLNAIVALVGVIKAGAAVLPLDLDHPQARLGLMLSETGAKVVLTDQASAVRLPASNARIIALDEMRADPPSSASPVCPAGPTDLLYILYTSGSTGTPKGVAMPHRPLVNLIDWQMRQPGLDRPARVLQFTPLIFDVAFQEIGSTLCQGGTLVLIDDDRRRDMRSLLATLNERRVERLFLPFVALQHLAHEAGPHGLPDSLRDIVTAGEQLRITPAIRSFLSSGRCRLHNHYGPTETHTVTAHTLTGSPDSWDILPPIGAPVANVKIELLDAHGRAVPIGVPGELYAGGVALAQGYLQRAELTSERFIDHPTKGRLYRTGDLARWRAEGVLDYLGRRDHQIKLRGFRIELTEIEAVLNRHPAVREAAVIVHGEGDLRRLAAYVGAVNAQSLLHDELLSHLRDHLPAYMMPSTLAVLESLPQTPTGKVDRRALPAPASVEEPTQPAAYSETENLLAQLWGQLLGLSHVSPTANFFALGGHSLLATRLVSRIRDVFTVDLPLQNVFETPTVSGLARLIDSGLGEEPVPALQPLADGAVAPLSFSQRRLWFLEELEGPSAAYSLPATLELSGSLDVEALRRSLCVLVERHGGLRTRFPAFEGDPRLELIEPYDPLSFTDLTPLPPDDRMAEARRLSHSHAAQPFDLTRGPLFRIHVLRLDTDKHWLLFNLHHIVTDGWSLNVMQRELAQLYAAELAGLRATLPSLPVQFPDYSAWQRAWLNGETLERQLAYWQERLTGAPTVLELPTDRPRGPRRTYRGGLVRSTLGGELVSALDQLNLVQGSTRFMSLLAVFNMLLWRHTGQADLLVGVPVANRRHSLTEGILGFFVNTLVLRTQITERQDFASLLKQTRKTCLDAYAHQDLPFEHLVERLQVERSLAHTPLFQVMLTLQNTPADEIRLQGVSIEAQPPAIGVAKFDLTLLVEERASGLVLLWEYNADLFDAERIERMAAHFEELLNSALARPTRPVGEFEMLTAPERRQLVAWGEGPQIPLPSVTVVRGFELQAQRTPTNLAVACGDESLDYAALNRRANQLAHHLRAAGVGGGDRVAICLPRSIDFLVGVLATLKAAATYVPIDPNYPRARLEFILSDCAAKLLISHEPIVAQISTDALPLCLLDRDAAAIGRQAGEDLESGPTADDVAYVIYTSGSTGEPKGAGVFHRGFANLLQWYVRTLELSAQDRTLLVSAIGFDLTQKNLFGPLLVGGSLHMLAEEGFNPQAIVATIGKQAITWVNCTPSTFYSLIDDNDPASLRWLAPLRWVVLGGEPIQMQALRHWLDRPDCRARILNSYGPTECTDICGAWAFDAASEEESVPLGRPIDNVTLAVLDEHRRPVMTGLAGELWIGGVGVGAGYLNQDKLNASFATIEWAGRAGRMYRTGDRVRWRPDGVLEFLGRKDTQIKLRGFRIELGEIESALRALPGIEDAVVIVHGEGAKQTLIAYVVGDLTASTDIWASALRANLPSYMVPARFIRLDRLPLTPNGKVDRGGLPKPELVQDPGVDQAPRSPTETRLSQLWETLLGRSAVDRHADFFALGGHSLLATRLISRIREAFKVDLPVRALFEQPTVAGLATLIDAGRDLKLPPLLPQPAGTELVLSFAQQRLWFLDQLEGKSAAYNMAGAFELRGALNEPVLRLALCRLVERHAGLRLCFPSAGGEPVARLLPVYDPLTRADLSLLPEAARLSAAERQRTEHANRPFDLAEGPLLRLHLLRLEEGRHWLLFNMHHIIGDGWSIDLLIREMDVLYGNDGGADLAELPPLSVQYPDYAAWQRNWLQGPTLQAALDYWRGQLDEAAEHLELPTDFPRPAIQRHRGAEVRLTIDPAQTKALASLANSNGATLFMALLAVFKMLLYRFSGQRDISVGTPVANRDHRQLEDVVGLFLDTLVLRTKLSSTASFRALLADVRRTALGAYAHQELPFEYLVEQLRPQRSLSHHPLFQVMLNLVNTRSAELTLDGLQVQELTAPKGLLTKFDLSLSFTEVDGGLNGRLEYNAELFNEETAAFLAECFSTLVAAVVSRPDASFSELSVLNASRRAHLAALTRARPATPPIAFGSIERSIADCFAEIVRNHPEHVAVESSDQRLTYRMLDEAARRLAATILALPAAPRIALLLPHDASMTIGIMGVLYAARTYIPLHPTHPVERLKYIVEDTSASIIVCSGPLRALAHELAGDNQIIVDVDDLPAGGDVDLPAASADSIAYAIYTSGSTGRPKGVVQSHRNVLHFIRQYVQNLHIAPGDRLLQVASYAFDAGVMDIFGALLSGATLCPVDLTQVTLDDAGERLFRDGHTILHMTPTVYRLLVAELRTRLPAVRLVVLGGEAVVRSDVDAFRKHFEPGCLFVNGLGPTESTVTLQGFFDHATALPRFAVPVGSPVGDTEILLVDADGVSNELFGEILIRSPHVALGYLNADSSAFRDDPGRPGWRMYRTGDVARLLPDGSLEVVGRRDNQVKIRGFRVELGEIEAVLRQHPGVRDAGIVLIADDDEPAGRSQPRLVAYASGSVQVAELKDYVKGHLPDYMVPAAFVLLDQLPVTANGKLDRARLPAPDLTTTVKGQAPRNQREEALCGLFAEVLGLESVGIDDDFFALGGHSLLATRLASRIRTSLGVEVAIRSLFEAPTVADLAQRLDGAQAVRPLLQRMARPAQVPLSAAQRRLWFLERMEGPSATYTIPLGVRMSGELDMAALEAALGDLTERHESLRTVFPETGGVPHQYVLEAASSRPALRLASVSEADLPAALAEAIGHGFDLTRELPLRAHLFRCGSGEQVLLLLLHHIAGDGWSLAPLARDLAFAYAARKQGRAPAFAALPVQYADYTLWQEQVLGDESDPESAVGRQLSYWKEALAQLPEQLDLASDHPRPAVASYRGASVPVWLPAPLHAGLLGLARTEQASLFMVLQAGLAVLLSRLSGGSDHAIGSPIAGRNDSALDELVGFFVNTLVLRTDTSGNPSFRELIGRVRSNDLAAYSNQEVPFERLVEVLNPARSLSRHPLFQVMLALQNNEAASLEGWPGLTVRVEPFERRSAKFDLSLGLVEERGADGKPAGLAGVLEYATDLFEPATVLAMVDRLARLLEQAVADPDRRIGSLELLTPAERSTLAAWNDTARPLPSANVVELFTAQAALTPDAVALAWDGRQLSYGELDARANQLAHHLRGLGVGPEVMVALCAGRSPELVIGVLGILKAGGGYLPLDPAYPRDRLAFMLADAGAKVLVTQASLAGSMPADGLPVVLLDEDAAAIAKQPAHAPASGLKPENVAYVIYTSGSTGTPKGVVVTHANIVRLVKNTNYVALTPDDVVLLMAPLTFDASTFEIWGALLNGARLALYPDGPFDIARLKQVVSREHVSVAWLTAAVFHQVVDEDPEALVGVKTLLAGGDVLSAAHVRRHLERAAAWGGQLVNGYGPTEGTTFSACFPMRHSSDVGEQVPIGGPISNTRLHVLDANLAPVPAGVAGELYIAGDGLARGYLGRAGLTAERFVPDPHGAPGSRMYHTGDLARWRADGTLDFLGRMDGQLKLRGFRIEPGEIEACLMRHGVVAQAAVIARDDAGLGKQLVAYVVAAEGAAVDTETLRRHVKQHLPDYMVPAAFVLLDQLPVTANGKLDRARLPAPDLTTTVKGQAPRTPTEDVLSRLWERVLGQTDIATDANFFALGGHSLLATQLVSRIRDVFAIDLPLQALFEHTQLAEQAALIEQLQRGYSLPSIEPLADRAAAPLSFAQQRLWFLNQLEPDSPFYNTPMALRFSGHLDKPALQAALQDVVDRHDILRTAIHNQDGQPRQVTLAELHVPLVEVDLSALPSERREAALLDQAQAEARRAFPDLGRPPLLRAVLFSLAADEHALLLTMHHIITDGWSLAVLTRELAHLYKSRCGSEAADLPKLPIQYADFAAWQRGWLTGEVQERQLAYWRDQLAGATPMLTLPTDHARPAVQKFRGSNIRFKVDRATRDALDQLGRANNSTLFMTLLSAFFVLLHRYSGQADIVVGSPIANRRRSELEGLLGFFVNTLALRVKLDHTQHFQDVLKHVRRTALDAYAHQDLPFEMLVDELQPQRDLSRNPLFQVMFALQNMPTEVVDIEGLQFRPLHLDRNAALFDLVLDVWDAADGLHCVLEFDLDLFDTPTAERIARHFTVLLRSIAADPDSEIDAFDLLDAEERQQLLAFANGPRVDHPVDQSLVAIFEAQVAANPGRVAAVADGIAIDYAELNERANRIGHMLHAVGVRPGASVGLLVPRGHSYLAAMLGVAKAGAAFLPLDVAYPSGRLRYMIEDSGIAVLVTTMAGLALFDQESPPHALVDVVLIDGPDAKGMTLPTGICLHTTSELARQPVHNPPIANGPRDVLYVLYTSGSTGLPKGAMVRHDGALNHIFAEFGLLSFHPDTAFLQSAPASSDISVWQCLAPLLIGARTVFADHETMYNPPALFDLIRRERVTLIELVPAVLEALLTYVDSLPATGRGLDDLEWAMVTGEAAPAALIDRWFGRWPAIPLVNAYGPTEAADDVCQHVLRGPLADRQSFVPIGRPLDNLSVMVLDQRGGLVPIGVPGQLCVGGIGVGPGYWRQPERTAAAFMPNPLLGETFGETIYLTGDLGRWHADGSLEFVGRVDHQVKIRGFRVELGEIETALSRHQLVRDAIVLDYQNRDMERELVAYLLMRRQTSDNSVSAQEQVAQWKDLHENSYSDTHVLDQDPQFNIIGWDSTFTGEPYSAAAMGEAVDNAVSRILALAPRSLLEIGCGTGLLLYRLVPHCSHYLGTDISAVAIGQLEDRRRQLSIPELDRVELLTRPADDFSGFASASFDTVVLNSVVQYFPDVDYLLRVLREAVGRCAPGGSIFIGDVRSLPLLRSYHASLECFKADDSTSRSQLTARIEAQLRRGQELALAPQFFLMLADELQRVGRVTIRPKRGSHVNEMTQFRYDVTLHLDCGRAPAAPAHIFQDWRDSSLQLADIRAHLQNSRPDYWGLRHIANGRLLAERRIDDWLAEAPAGATVGALRSLLSELREPAIDPEALWQLESELPYRIELRVEPDSPDGAFAALFVRDGCAPVEIDDSQWHSTATNRPATDFANDPLHEKAARDLVPALRTMLRSTLPDHMIPRSFVVLPSFPLAPSGKVDRQALPPPDFDLMRSTEFVAPRTRIEQGLQAIWASVLGIPNPGVTDNFFDLGGHSLKATQVVSRIQQVLHRTVSVRSIFSHPTIEELAVLVGEQLAVDMPEPIARMADASDYPTARAQQRLWVLAEMGGTAAYNMAESLRLRGPLHAEALARAFKALADRHEVLRASFVEIDGELRSRIAADVPPMDIVDVSTARDPLAAGREIALWHATREFDLARGPLISVRLVRLGAGDHLLLFNIHHIVSDGWSLDVLVRDLMAFYEAAVEERAPALPALGVRYRDYVAWHEQRLARAGDEQGAYWRKQLAGSTPLELSAAAPRPPVKTYRGAHRSATFPPPVHQALSALSQRRQASMFMLLIAMVKVVLHRYSGASDISVGSPVAGRNHPELENLIGFFVNTVVLRDQIDGAQPFASFLEGVKETVIAAYDAQDYPFDQLVLDLNPSRDPSRNPLFDVMVALQNTANIVPRMSQIEITSLGLESGLAQFDLLWSFTETSQGLQLDLRYNADLYSPDSAGALIDALKAVAAGVVAAPETPLNRLPLLTQQERRALLEVVPASNDFASSHPSLVHWFEAQAAVTPDRIAVQDQSNRLTYAQLNACANRIGRALKDRLAGDGAALVGLRMHRSVALVAAVLGILKAGAAYVPIDPDIPAARQRFILEDADVAVLVTDGEADLPADLRAVHYAVDLAALLNARNLENLEIAVAPATPAYVIYTSGSTGEPKGVVVTHANVLRLFTATQPWFEFSSTDVWTLFHSYAFDFSVWEIWGALLHGGRLVVVPYEVSRAPDQFYELLSSEGVTVLNQTPSAFRQLQQAEAERGAMLPLALRYVIFGGEALEPAQLRPWFERHGDARPQLVNMYGITETTVHVTYRPLTVADTLESASPIGISIPDLYLRVLDEFLEPVPPYMPGELFVGGAGLAHGYLNREALTAERFIADPFLPAARLYRTGDQARRRRDGEIEYLGRIDEQVKIRGFRIEPGEIAATLSRYPGIADAAVVPRKRDGDTMLVAYYVAIDEAIDAGSLRRHLQQQLPPYMVPTSFVPLPRLPLTGNGKLDRRALPDPVASTEGRPIARAPGNAFEARVTELWRGLLGHDALGPDDNVFDHGAHSMLVVRARNELQKSLGRAVPVVLLFQCPTPATLAVALLQSGDDGAPDRSAEERAAQRHNADREQAGRRRAARQRDL